MDVKRRLDHILLERGYITEAQLQDSLNRQRAHGGKVGAALMFLRYITEAQLVEALSIQFNVPGVVLSNIEIPDDLATVISERTMRSKLVVPFKQNTSGHVLSVAVVDPLQPGLRAELEFALRGQRVELLVATEVSVQTAISSLLDGTQETVEDKLMMEFPEGLLEEETDDDPSGALSRTDHRTSTGRVLIVSSEQFSVRHVRAVIEREGPSVSLISSIDALPDMLSSGEFSAVYVQQKLSDDKDGLRSLIRSHSMQTRLLWFDSCSDWLVSGPQESASIDVAKEYDTLLNILVADRFGDSEKNRSMMRYVGTTCDRLGIWGSERNTMFLVLHLYIVAHSLGLTSPTQGDGHARLKAIADFFEGAQSNHAVIAPLIHAYQQLDTGQIAGAVSDGLLGGNIVTALDIVYQWIGDRDRIRIDEFDDVRNLLNDQTGTLLLPSVTEAVLHAISELHLANELDEPAIEVIVYRSPNLEAPVLRELALLERSMRLVNAFTALDLAATVKRRTPHMMILALPADEGTLQASMKSITDDLDLAETPTLALTDCDSRAALEAMYSAGVVDTMPMDTSANAVSAKIKSVIERSQAASESSATHKGEARGDLENMNLIDLIQAMGPGRKTAEIIIEHENDKLKLFMIEGQIVYAEGCGGVGQEPIFRGVQWQQGSFLVRRVDVADIPPPNIDVSNEHILMEGCRLMDEG